VHHEPERPLGTNRPDPRGTVVTDDAPGLSRETATENSMTNSIRSTTHRKQS
jgi:hypothetical protein